MNLSLPPFVDQSGFRDLVGIRQFRVDDGGVGVELDIGAQHMNPAGILHGGVVATMIDIAGSLAVSYDAAQKARLPLVTLTLTTSFTGASRAGTLRAVGTAKKIGFRTAFATVDVLDSDGTLIAFGEATYMFRRSAAAATT